MAAVYLDCNATTPIEPQVRDLVAYYFYEGVGNPGSRTHEFGQQASQAIQRAREQVASVVTAEPNEVLFTSGATESNNLALLGLAPYGEKTGRKHIVSTAIEHKAVLEPLEALEQRGFEVTLVPPDSGGVVPAASVLEAVRSDTLMVSAMHVNNETGVHQPIAEIANGLENSEAYFHVDAAQGFGKVLKDLRSPRIDLISASSHKIYGPAGVGALIARRRRYRRPPLTPLTYGGGQERGLRPGTLPTPLIAGFGLAAEFAEKYHETRREQCLEKQRETFKTFSTLDMQLNGNQNRMMPHVLNCSFKNVDSEALMLKAKELVAISNGSACTSVRYEKSHVLQAMGLPDKRVENALRFSWCHLTPEFNLEAFKQAVSSLS